MKKSIIGIVMLLSVNIFSSQNLNNKWENLFPNREVKSLIFGHYNLDKELAVTSKFRGVDQETLIKAENDAKKGLENAIKEYSYSLLKENLSGTLVTGPGFDRSKMREFSTEISKKMISNGRKVGTWKTSKNEIVVLYTIDKDQIKSEANNLFNERLDSVIRKLNEYRNVFDSMNR